MACDKCHISVPTDADDQQRTRHVTNATNFACITEQTPNRNVATLPYLQHHTDQGCHLPS